MSVFFVITFLNRLETLKNTSHQRVSGFNYQLKTVSKNRVIGRTEIL